MMVVDVIKMQIEILTLIVAFGLAFGPEGPHELDRCGKCFFQRAVLMRIHPNEPYLHSIKYTVLPSTKPFWDMSCGEKTVAALALLFAIYRYNGMWVLLVGLVGCCLCVLD
jgi:chromosome segregation ATPase